MRKLLFFILPVLLFISCDNFTQHDFTISNNSSSTVDFTINNYGDTSYTLKSGESDVYYLYHDPAVTIKNHARVTFISGESDGYFMDLKATTYTFCNFTNTAITVAEKNGALTDIYNNTITVSAFESSSEYVYSNSPVFIITDTDNNICNYTIENNTVKIIK